MLPGPREIDCAMDRRHILPPADDTPAKGICSRLQKAAPLQQHLIGSNRLSTYKDCASENQRWELLRKELNSHEACSKWCSRLGLSEQQLREVFAATASTSVACPEPVPDVLRLDRRSAPSSIRSHVDPKLVEFGDIIEPVAQAALERLISTLGSESLSIISHNALGDIRNALTHDLSVIARQALLQEFQLFRNSPENIRHTLIAKIAQNDDDALYRSFVRDVTRDGGSKFYSQYPVIARLFTLRVNQWVENAKTFICAYRVDRCHIELALGCGTLGTIERITAGLSDPHNGGKHVLILSTTSKQKVVFKPRSVELDAGFMRILAYLNDKGSIPLFRVVRVLSRETHGWCEYIEHTTTEDPETLSMFYFRTGALLAALHVFRATDCHSENFIASGNYPVMIDLETLFHCDYDFFTKAEDRPADQSVLSGSVSRIGLLPSARDTSENLDLSPLGIRLRSQVSASYRFENLGSVHMGLNESLIPVDEALSQPSKKPVDASVIISEVKAGFRHAYELIQSHANEIISKPKLLPSLRRASCRFVIRPTAAYYWLRQRGLHPDFLRDGVDRSLTFARVFRAWAQTNYSDQWYAIAQQEAASLEDHDIPYFSVRLDKRALYCNGQEAVRKLFRYSPWTLVKRRLRSLSARDCNTQLQIIDFSFAQQGVVCSKQPNESKQRSQPSRTLNAVFDLATQIQSASVGQGDPSNSWLGLIPGTEEGFFQMGMTGSGLYKGSAGIALFFAAAYTVEGTEEFKRLASEILYSLASREHASEVTGLLDLGDGAAGLTYALMRGGTLLKDRELCAQASRLAHSISDSSILNGECIDVLGGTAGIILALDVVNRSMPSHALSRKMNLAGERLMRASHSITPQRSAWQTLDGRYLPGFAHGSAGISYALARAGTFLKRSRFLRASLLGQRNQERFFNEREGYWADPRLDNEDRPLNASWCHGTIGIALSYAQRNGSLALPSYQLQAVMNSINTMLTAENSSHNICCGVAGALEVILRLHNAPSVAHAQKLACELLTDTSAYRFKPLHSPTPFISGFFDGAAGIGYQMLRAMAPDKVPSILTFE